MPRSNHRRYPGASNSPRTLLGSYPKWPALLSAGEHRIPCPGSPVPRCSCLSITVNHFRRITTAPSILPFVQPPPNPLSPHLQRVKPPGRGQRVGFPSFRVMSCPPIPPCLIRCFIRNENEAIGLGGMIPQGEEGIWP